MGKCYRLHSIRVIHYFLLIYNSFECGYKCFISAVILTL